jgi:hypothetical protein
MVIPLALRSTRDDRLVYGIPAWYRVIMGLILAVIATAVIASGERPGIAGWIVLALTLLSFLYDERWTFDKANSVVKYRAGLLIAARLTELGFDQVKAIALKPFVRGTIPGSEDEAAENKAALEGGRADDKRVRRALFKKPYICLIVETEDGNGYFVEAVPARELTTFKQKASRIASYCEKPLTEG